MNKPKLTISLVTYNGADYLTECLESISKQTLTDCELVVLDNASTDGSQVLISKHAPKARLISLGENIGFTRGHNEVIRSSGGEYILILNQDVVLSPDYCERLVAFLDEHKDYGGVAGLLLAGRQEDLTKEVISGTVDSCGLSVRPGQWIVTRGAGRDVGEFRTSGDVWGLSAAAAVYRRSALEDIGFTRDDGVVEYFDEDFFMYQDDGDLSYRLRWRGWKMYFLSSAVGWHDRTRKDFLERSSAKINYWSYRNHWYLIIKNVSGGIWLRWGLFIMGFELLKLGYLMLFEWGTLQALPEVLSMRNRMLAKRTWIMSRRSISNSEMSKSFHL